MALKTTLDVEDDDTFLVDIPLFATAQDAVKDIQLDELTVKINVIENNQEDK